MKSRELVFSITKKDFEIQTFRSGGPGGQNQNKVESGVRIIHKESGLRAESREFRDQIANRKAAFRRLVNSPEFRQWIEDKVNADVIEQRVNDAMKPENLLIEGVDD